METKAEIRAVTARAVDEFLARGGEIHRAPDHEGTSMTEQDWARAARGLKVASPEDIEAERTRRLHIAIGNRDTDLCAALLTGRHDRAIKFDIENGRLGPNGEIR